MGCLIGLILVLFTLMFRFLFLACGVTCIAVGTVYIFSYLRAVVAGVAVSCGMMYLIGSIGLIILGVFFLKLTFKKSEKKSEQ